MPATDERLTIPEAIERASKYLEGKVQLQGTLPPTADSQGDLIVVTFPHVHPRGVRGSGFDARVTVDRRTGDVTKLEVAE
jgi:hypothetical protein